MKYLLFAVLFGFSACAASTVLDQSSANHPANSASAGNAEITEHTKLDFSSDQFRSKTKVKSKHHQHHQHPSSRPASQPSSQQPHEHEGHRHD